MKFRRILLSIVVIIAVSVIGLKHRTRRRLLRTALICAVIALSFASAELWARRELEAKPDVSQRMTSDVVDAWNDFTNIRWSADAVSLPDDYAGRYMNIAQHQRVTVGQPAHPINDIYIFGSSTAFGLFTDDAHTIASLLQSRLPSSRVHNMGLIGAPSRVMIAYLRETALHPGDIIIFYGGIADVENMADDVQAHCNFLSLALLTIICNHTLLESVDGYGDIEHADLDRYRRMIQASQQYSAAAGATFYNVLEPHIETLPYSADEIDYPAEKAIDMPAVYSAMYSQMATIPRTIDLEHVLRGVSLYADRVHPNARGDAIVARAIYAAVWRTF